MKLEKYLTFYYIKKKEELKKKQEEDAKAKADWLKKSKKKKWTGENLIKNMKKKINYIIKEEDEKQTLEKYREKFSGKCSEIIIEKLENFDYNVEYIKIMNLIDKQRSPLSYFKNLMRKKPLSDMDLEGRRIVLRIHLKFSDSYDTYKKKLGFKDNINIYYWFFFIYDLVIK